MGRPTTYAGDVHDRFAMALAAEGKTESEIAKAMGIALSSLSLWKKKHKSFSDSLKKGKQSPDDKVEASLYKRCIGYEARETQVVRKGNSKSKPSETKTVLKSVAPDVTACIFWLKNRRKDRWRDVKHIDGDVARPTTVNIIMPDNGRDPDVKFETARRASDRVPSDAG